MTLVSIITDTHFGARGDSIQLLANQEKFLSDIFWPTLKERNVDFLFHLGDLVDRRKYINFNTAATMRRIFLDPLTQHAELGRFIIPGNHDVYYKSTNDINAFNELLGAYSSKIEIIHEPQEISFSTEKGIIKCLFVPWINPNNYDRCLQAIKNTSATLCFGHFEIKGFTMHLGQSCEHGMDKGIFDKFDMVFSGHFHEKSSQHGIHYLGSPFQLTWADFGSKRGFHILNLQTRELEFIQNPYDTFHKLYYNDQAQTTMEELTKQLDFIDIKNCFIKVYVETKDNPYLFDLFIKEIEDQEPFDVKIMEDMKIYQEEVEDFEEAESTEAIIFNTIDKMEISCDKDALKNLVYELHKEAHDLESDSCD